MNENIEMLNYIYQNSSMGITTIQQILKDVDDLEFKDVLKEQLEDYIKISRKAEDLLNMENKQAKDIGVMYKVTTYLSIKMSTMKDNTSSHIAEMMVQGSNMGVIDITKNLNNYKNIENTIRSLAEQLLKIEQNNIEKLKPYL
jgi:hypothetical protein